MHVEQINEDVGGEEEPEQVMRAPHAIVPYTDVEVGQEIKCRIEKYGEDKPAVFVVQGKCDDRSVDTPDKSKMAVAFKVGKKQKEEEKTDRRDEGHTFEIIMDLELIECIKRDKKADDIQTCGQILFDGKVEKEEDDRTEQDGIQDEVGHHRTTITSLVSIVVRWC
jgi:hypothetical protein